MEEDLNILSKEEILKRLAKFPGWKFGDDKIKKTFEFSSFTEAVDFVRGLVNFCNNIDHHPDIQINYKKVTFELQTSSVGSKVTERDLTVAREIERLYLPLTLRFGFH